MDKLPKEFYSEDMIYHYTSMETAVNHILPTGKLMLKKRVLQSDPLEKTILNSYYIGEMVDSVESIDLSRLNIQIKDFLESILQLSLCQNKVYRNSNLTYQNSYGFRKFRMWLQYADEFQGVCFAFSKKELINCFKRVFKSDTFIEEVKYLPIEKVERTLDTNIASNDEKDIGEMLKKFLFLKYDDFENENEFRFCVKSQNAKVFFPFENSLKGIFYYANESHISKTKELMFKYLKEYSASKDLIFKGLFFYNGSFNLI